MIIVHILYMSVNHPQKVHPIMDDRHTVEGVSLVHGKNNDLKGHVLILMGDHQA